jgi:hypothetical protein
MNYAIDVSEINTKSHVMEFLSIHKWTALILGGGLLTIPVLPPETGWVGLGLIVFGVWRQWVEVGHAKADAKRKQEQHVEQLKRDKELHEEKIRLLGKLHVGQLDANDLAVLRELLGG